MRRDVSEMKNVCTTKSWADVCGGDVVSNSSNMHVINQKKNIESIDVWELSYTIHMYSLHMKEALKRDYNGGLIQIRAIAHVLISEQIFTYTISEVTLERLTRLPFTQQVGKG
mgnify:CR=1 FL=1